MDHDSSRRQALRQLIGLTATATLASQGHGQTTDDLNTVIDNVKALNRRGTATLRLLYPEGCLDNLNPVVSAFTRATEVPIELVAGSLEFIGSEIRFNHTVRGQRNAFDLAIPATYSLPDMIGEGLLEDLSRYRDQHEPASLRAQMLYTLGDSFDGAFYGYQTDGDAYLAFFNHGVAGYDDTANRYADTNGKVLTAPGTWAELDRQLAAFHQPDKGLYGGLLYRTKRYVTWEYWSRLHAKGVFPVDDEFVPQFDSELGIEALQELITASQWLAPNAQTNGLFQNFADYAKGHTYINLGWGGTQKYLQRDDSRVRETLTHAALPGGTDSKGAVFDAPIFNWGWNLVVPSGSTKVELAYLFSLFATLPSMSTLSVQQQGGYFDPHQRDHYKDPTIARIYGASFLDAHEHSMSRCIPDFHVYNQERYMRILGEALYAATRGYLRPDISLREAARQWQQLTADIGRAKQTQQWQKLKTSYPTHILAVAT